MAPMLRTSRATAAQMKIQLSPQSVPKIQEVNHFNKMTFSMASLLLSARKSKQFLEKKDDSEKPANPRVPKRKTAPPKEEDDPKATKPKKSKKNK